MLSSKRKNKASFYRRLLGMTQTDVAKILKTGKSNVANMESEKHSPSEAYRRILNLAPRELTSPVPSMGKSLRSQNVFHYSVGENNSETPYKVIHRKQVMDLLHDLPDCTEDADFFSSPIGEFEGTDIYIWKATKSIPSLDIEGNELYPVIPRFYYKDDAAVLYRKTLTEFEIATVAENGTKLLSAEDGMTDPDICLVEIIGEILTK